MKSGIVPRASASVAIQTIATRGYNRNSKGFAGLFMSRGRKVEQTQVAQPSPTADDWAHVLAHLRHFHFFFFFCVNPFFVSFRACTVL